MNRSLLPYESVSFAHVNGCLLPYTQHRGISTACGSDGVLTQRAKETYSYGKRDLFIWQKRPIHMSEEAYSYGKRDCGSDGALTQGQLQHEPSKPVVYSI